MQTWGVLPRAHWATLAFGDKVSRRRRLKCQCRCCAAMTRCQDLRSASNIVFTNGVLDPWRAGGVIVSDASALPPSIVSIVIADGELQQNCQWNASATLFERFAGAAAPPVNQFCPTRAQVLTILTSCLQMSWTLPQFARRVCVSYRRPPPPTFPPPSTLHPPPSTLLSHTYSQHIITWLAPYSSPSPPPSQCSASAVPVWPWLALALLALQLASLALFKRHMNSLHRGHVTDDSRAPLLV